ncbi:protein of unknown function [Sterolibacterium denitrificans]|uniref:Uncharacterized protein n=1 Tax=Sterolibacterium denitrificans TaxID=157592 RepID=A0A7Z7HQW5_9PROT|nr:protein of unknown function [Sterolibacterium denitrificans]
MYRPAILAEVEIFQGRHMIHLLAALKIVVTFLY